jgi:hypothetical protein
MGLTLASALVAALTIPRDRLPRPQEPARRRIIESATMA